MSSFTKELQVRPLSNGFEWELLAPFTYYVGELNSSTYVEVESGFTTDFASVPRMFWSILPPWGVYGAAAVIHDYLWIGKEMVVNGERKAVDRKTANLIFLEAMGVLDVNVAVRYTMYWAVCANAAYKQLLSKVTG